MSYYITSVYKDGDKYYNASPGTRVTIYLDNEFNYYINNKMVYVHSRGDNKLYRTHSIRHVDGDMPC